MFGIDDMLLLSALGAGGGALFNKKDPLKGAAIGGLLGAGGGALMPAAGAGSQAGLLAAQEAGLGSAAMGWGGASTGLQGALNSTLGAEAGAATGGLLGGAAEVGKPAMTALDAAQKVQALTPQEQPIQASPFSMSGAQGPGGLTQIAHGNQQQIQMQQQADEMRRQRRHQQLKMMRGY